ncbi:MAG: 50S ribosomal protein L21 [Nitrospiria bacterium]
MRAVVETGGKQYRVAVGDLVEVEKCEAEVGEKIAFSSVLMLEDDQQITMDAKALEGAKVVGEVLAQGRYKKIRVFKKKRRKNYRRSQGHRQSFTRLKISEIVKE